jgi:sugar (pentulose or hexulose) kinase
MAQSKTVTLQKKIDRQAATIKEQAHDITLLSELNNQLNADLTHAERETDQLHALLDQQPGAPPREYTVAGVTYTPNLTARILAWLAHK